MRNLKEKNKKMISLTFLVTFSILLLVACDKKEKAPVSFYLGLYPVLSQDHKKVLCSPLIDGNHRLILYDLESNKALHIKPPLPLADTFINPLFSPVTNRIYFIWRDNTNNISEICQINIDGTNFKKLTSFGMTISSIFISHTGEKLGFIMGKNKSGLSGDIYIYDLRVNKTKKIFDNNEFFMPYNPSFSQTADKIYFSSRYNLEGYDKGSYSDFKLLELDCETGTILEIIKNKELIIPVSFPNSKNILYLGTDQSIENTNKPAYDETRKEENRGMFIYSYDEKKLKLLLKDVYTTNYYLSISPDGKKALFISGDDIVQYDLEKNEIKKLDIDKKEILRSFRGHLPVKLD